MLPILEREGSARPPVESLEPYRNVGFEQADLIPSRTLLVMPGGTLRSRAQHFGHEAPHLVACESAILHALLT
jgi:hypothetical protein